MKYVIGLDLGQSADYSAVCVLERIPHPVTIPGRTAIEDNCLVRQAPRTETTYTYAIPHLDRYPLQTPYPVIVEKVRGLLGKLQDARLVLDQTGCGRPVYDLFEAAGLHPVGVSITAGTTTTHEGREWRVPKRDLVSALSVALQEGTLKIAKQLPYAPDLAKEMQNFRVKIDPQTAHDSYASWREGEHDDLVLCVSLALWGAKNLQTGAGFMISGFIRRW
jgi:hypothetical protein